MKLYLHITQLFPFVSYIIKETANQSYVPIKARHVVCA